MNLNSNETRLNPSPWVQRWSHLAAPGARVLDVACGAGRHMQWFATRGCRVTGIDRNADALLQAAAHGSVVLADIETAAWPLVEDGQVRQFEVVVVTNYLWRALFPTLLASVAPGGVLIYETFAQGNERYGKPSRPDFLLQEGELLQHCRGMTVVAFEQGWLPHPERVLQRIVALQRGTALAPAIPPAGSLPQRPVSLE